MYVRKNKFLWCLYFSLVGFAGFYARFDKMSLNFLFTYILVFIINVRNGYNDTIGISRYWCRRCSRRHQMYVDREYENGVGMCVSVPHIHTHIWIWESLCDHFQFNKCIGFWVVFQLSDPVGGLRSYRCGAEKEFEILLKLSNFYTLSKLY